MDQIKLVRNEICLHSSLFLEGLMLDVSENGMKTIVLIVNCGNTVVAWYNMAFKI